MEKLSKKTIAMNRFKGLYENGDYQPVFELSKLNKENQELKKLAEDCWTHEYFINGGEPYDVFKKRYFKILSEYIENFDIERLD